MEPGKFLFKMGVYTLLCVIGVAFALVVLVPGFGPAFISQVAYKMETWVLIGVCLLIGISMARPK